MEVIKHFDNGWYNNDKDFKDKIKYYPHYYNINELNQFIPMNIYNEIFLINIKNFNKSNLFNLLSKKGHCIIVEIVIGVLLAENHLKVSNIFNHDCCSIDNLDIIIRFDIFRIMCMSDICDNTLMDVEFSIIRHFYNYLPIHCDNIIKYNYNECTNLLKYDKCTNSSTIYECIYFIKKMMKYPLYIHLR
jgi:hypothetical protein